MFNWTESGDIMHFIKNNSGAEMVVADSPHVKIEEIGFFEHRGASGVE